MRKTVLNFVLQDFYENWAGEVYIDWLRRNARNLPTDSA
jgi:hypothetical protein